MIRRAILCLFFFNYYIVSIAQRPGYFQQRVDFNIRVTLNDIEKSLDGFEDIIYTNNSPDTLNYLWFHLWPNAYKNDRTAFSEQLLQNGRNDFYFSKEEQRGYINRLDFKVDGNAIKWIDSSAIDITKLILNTPLPPGATIHITTPFHEKLPYNFSRGGYYGNTFQITQWYPKPAVYDQRGWHTMSYLDQGEFFSEFGKYNVDITVPEKYIIASTGELQNVRENEYLLYLAKSSSRDSIIKAMVNGKGESSRPKIQSTNSKEHAIMKTLHYSQDNIHDFAWFAGKRYLIQHDTIQTSSGRIINLWAYYNRSNRKVWKNSLQYIKKTIQSRSKWLGEYPYNIVSVVEANLAFTGGMEYPTITNVSTMPTGRWLEELIEHEVGHNWNYGILGSDERTHPWMDEGINTYYDRRYLQEVSPAHPEKLLSPDLLNDKLPLDLDDFFYRNIIEEKKDQPIETPSEKFSELNYNLIAYQKSALWMEHLDRELGRKTFDSLMHRYYLDWKFKHPDPQDFRNLLIEYAGHKGDSLYNLIKALGPISKREHRQLRIAPFLSFRRTGMYNYNFISPAIGYNHYDGVMLGLLFHNFTLPANKFQYLITPLYGTLSKQLNGIARFQYHWNSYGHIQQAILSLTSSRFSQNQFIDSTGAKHNLSFDKIVPSLRIFFHQDPRSTITKFIQARIFFINETNILFTRDTIGQRDIINYPTFHSYISQIKMVIDDKRSLYPYRAELQAEQSTQFAKLTFNGKYFLNYPGGGGLGIRLFVGKFFYIGDKTLQKQFETDRYHLNMTGASGYEDYTYSNYFVARNDFSGFASQQIMIRDGGFKVRSDLLSSKIGKTDNWLSAINFESDIPKEINPLNVLPIKIPIKLFVDAGTNGDAFKSGYNGSKFLYDAGIQISLFKSLVNVYIPVLYSKEYRDYYKSTFSKNILYRSISFSIDLQNLNLRKFNPQILL